MMIRNFQAAFPLRQEESLQQLLLYQVSAQRTKDLLNRLQLGKHIYVVFQRKTLAL
jgi:hypothetical protein